MNKKQYSMIAGISVALALAAIVMIPTEQNTTLPNSFAACNDDEELIDGICQKVEVHVTGDESGIFILLVPIIISVLIIIAFIIRRKKDSKL